MEEVKKDWIERLKDMFDFEDYKRECKVKNGESFSYGSTEYLFGLLPIILQSFIQDLLDQERKKTLEEVLKLPKGEIIAPTTIKGYKVIRVTDIEVLLPKLTTK